jgi:hypothetical protein
MEEEWEFPQPSDTTDSGHEAGGTVLARDDRYAGVKLWVNVLVVKDGQERPIE